MATQPENGRFDPRPAQSVISIVGGLIVILGAVWGIMVRPVEVRLAAMEAALEQQNVVHHDRLSRIDDKSRDTADHVIAITEQLREIETQFRWFSQLSNAQRERDGRLVQLLWKNVYDEDLPGIDYWPEVGDRNGHK